MIVTKRNDCENCTSTGPYAFAIVSSAAFCATSAFVFLKMPIPSSCASSGLAKKVSGPLDWLFCTAQSLGTLTLNAPFGSLYGTRSTLYAPRKIGFTSLAVQLVSIG